MSKTKEMARTLADAFNAPVPPVNPRMYLSCARCYVTVYGPKARTVKAAAAKLGIRWTYRGLYVGYDNATGYEYAKAEAIAKALKAAGVDCYAETVMD